MTVSASGPSDAAARPRPAEDRVTSRYRIDPVRAAAAIALVYFAAHLPFLPSALEDIDSVNFALALHDFDPALHRPHPPGYPIYIAMGRVSRAMAQFAAPGATPQAADARALAWWSAAGGATALLLTAPLFLLLARLSRLRDPEAYLVPSILLLATAPLFWMSGLRPLSDMPGLAAALAAQLGLLWACARAPAGRAARWYVPLAAAAAAAGLALGIRSQLLWLTAGPLAAAIVHYRHAGLFRAAAVTAVAFVLGALVWAIPLVVASGGVERYLLALRTMAAEDFSDVQMLWTHPSLRGLALALIDTFAKPWGDPRLAAGVIVAAVLGTGALAWRAPALLGWLAVLFGPYLVPHLLFQETAHVRYALPLLVPIAWAASALFAGIDRRVASGAAAAAAIVALVIVAPVVRAYADTPMPAAAGVTAAIDAQARDGGVIGSHFEFARTLSVSGVSPEVLLPSPRFGERLELLRYWEQGGRGPVWFVAAPARTDLDLIDPAARQLVFQSAWRFSREWFLGGIRPAFSELVRIASPPGWVAGEGWHLTREELILSDRRNRPEATMLIARRPGPAIAFVGGEYLPAPGAGTAVVRLTLDGRELTSIDIAAGEPRFFNQIALPAGTFDGAEGFATLTATWASLSSATPPRVHLTQFDLQPPDRMFWVYSHGWHDREFDGATGQEWRWTSGRAELRIHAAGRDLEVMFAGDAPVEALGGTPVVTVSAGAQLLHMFTPAGPFATTVRVPAAVLDASGGMLAIATSRTFVPGDGSPGSDVRRLGLRVFQMRVNPVAP